AGDRDDHPVRDPQLAGSGVPLGPRGRAERAAWARQARAADRPAASARSGDEGDGRVRALHRRAEAGVGRRGDGPRMTATSAVGLDIPTPPRRGLSVRRYLVPALGLLAIIGYWELHIRLFRVPEFLIPAPTAVVRAMAEE